MTTLRQLYDHRAKAAWFGHSAVFYDRLIRAALTATLQLLMDTYLRAAFMECHRRHRIAEGLSIGIERCAFRVLHWRTFRFMDEVCADHPAVEEVLSLWEHQALSTLLDSLGENPAPL